MAKTPNPRPEPDADADADAELDLSSLIDVSFLLLIFFLVSTVLIRPEFDLGMQLPGGGTAVDPDPPLHISIAGDGRVTVGGLELAGPSEPGEAAPVEQLRGELVEFRKRAISVGEQPLVSLSASSACDTQRFIDVINALSFAKIDHVAMVDDLAAN